MGTYSGSCTGEMLDRAGEMAQSIEMGRVTVTIASGQRRGTTLVNLTFPHNNPKIFLQITKGASTPEQEKTYSKIAYPNQVAPNLNRFSIAVDRTSNTQPEETVEVDYLVIDG